MEIDPDNVKAEDAIYEGILSGDGEGNYWISQGERSAQIDTTELDEEVLEANNGEVISVVGILDLEQAGNSALLSYELTPKIVAPFEGSHPSNDTYVTRIGDELIESYQNSVEQFEGSLEDLEEIDQVSY